MDFSDDVEPAPLVPGRSERLCVQSARQPWEDRDHNGAGPTLSSFGPNERNLSRCVASVQEEDTTPAEPSEPSVSRGSVEEILNTFGNNGVGTSAASRVAVTRQLQMAVWLADTRRVKELLRAGANVNEVDERGITPLMLAVELLPRSREYEDVLQRLLEHDADPRVRSVLGWSPLDEAVTRGDERLVRMLFEFTQRKLHLRWEARLANVVRSLQALPDFECRIRWEFESPVVPLLNKIAPSDVLRLRKRGTSLRLDSTLASWKRFRLSKRRDLTTLFQGEASKGPRLFHLNHAKRTITDMTEGLDNDETGAVVKDFLSGADVVQWDMQVDNLEVSESTTWLGQVAAPVEINGWRTTRFDVRGSLGVVIRKKGSRRNCATFEDYFGCPLPADACLPEFRQEFTRDGSAGSRQPSHGSTWKSSSVGMCDEQLQKQALTDMECESVDMMTTPSEVLSGWPQCATPSSAGTDNYSTISLDSLQRQLHCPHSLNGDRGSGGRSLPYPVDGSPTSSASSALAIRKGNDKVGKKQHTVSASVWLATNFAIPIQQFLPILEALPAEHEAMRRLKDLLNSQGLRDAAERAAEAAEAAAQAAGDPTPAGHVFPVKVSVPLNLAVRALVHFEAFELRRPGAFSDSLFEVPSGYTLAPRREAQKTMSRSRKRMLLAHLAL